MAINPAHKPHSMQLHASCAAREGRGVLLIGAPGSGKSDLVLRLLDHDFSLVADDRVDIEGVTASPPAALAGLLEVHGLGIVQLPFVSAVTLALVVQLGRGPRLPEPACYAPLGLPMVTIDPAMASAPARVRTALDCSAGRVRQVAGAFA